jgi:GNAT superfamily N-acetyltransferase
MQNYRIRKATRDDKELILEFYGRHEKEISSDLRKVHEFLDATSDVDVLLIQRVCQRGTLGRVIAACTCFYHIDEGIKYGSCSTGLVIKSRRRQGFSKALYRACETLFRQKGCQKVRNIRHTQMKHINLKKLKEKNWKVNVVGKMVILEKDL